MEIDIKYPSLIDFLEMSNEAKEPGLHYYFEEQTKHLEEIPKDFFGYEILNKASEGRPGLLQIYYIERELSEVFTTTKATSHTYVSRSYDKTNTYESTLELLLKEPGGIAVIYGPSKLGKSALWRWVINESSRITISCSNYMSIEDIHGRILFELNQPFISEVTDHATDRQQAGKSGEITLGKKDVAQVTIQRESTQEKEQGQQKIYKYPGWQNNVDTVIRAISGKNKSIIFENYHRLKVRTLKLLCMDLRTFADNNINVTFVGIPKDPYQIIDFNQELEGRVSFLKFTFWNNEDLMKIALGGQDALNAVFTDKTLKFVTNESAGSPFLMQFNCWIACIASSIFGRSDNMKTIDLSVRDFKLVMLRWGVQRIGACKQIYDRLSSIILRIPSLGTQFIQFILDSIKRSKAKLTLDLMPSFWPKKRAQIKLLLQRLNRYELTTDLFSLEEREGRLNINKPNFISYIRWLHNKNYVLRNRSCKSTQIKK